LPVAAIMAAEGEAAAAEVSPLAVEASREVAVVLHSSLVECEASAGEAGE
jgi:hypothetical protein